MPTGVTAGGLLLSRPFVSWVVGVTDVDGIGRVPGWDSCFASSTASPLVGLVWNGWGVGAGGGGGTLLGSGASATVVVGSQHDDARRCALLWGCVLVGVCLLFENCIVDASIFCSLFCC